jgi:hypothetical protein
LAYEKCPYIETSDLIYSSVISPGKSLMYNLVLLLGESDFYNLVNAICKLTLERLLPLAESLRFLSPFYFSLPIFVELDAL